MPGDHRVTLTRRHAYRTMSNRVKTIRTPGGAYKAQYLKKHRNGVICGEPGCDIPLPGIKHMDKKGFKTAVQRQKTVSRAYGGNRCAWCVKQKILRAFLVEEQKIVKKVLAEKLSGGKKGKSE
jgi:large subunit ribosomal protein L34e